jgi:hypothetical protein
MPPNQRSAQEKLTLYCKLFQSFPFIYAGCQILYSGFFLDYDESLFPPLVVLYILFLNFLIFLIKSLKIIHPKNHSKYSEAHRYLPNHQSLSFSQAISYLLVKAYHTCYLLGFGLMAAAIHHYLRIYLMKLMFKPLVVRSRL